jgi:hypothetical protein
MIFEKTSGVPNNKAFMNSSGIFSYPSVILRSVQVLPQWVVITAPTLSSAPIANLSIWVLGCPPGFYSYDTRCIACSSSDGHNSTRRDDPANAN